VNPTELDYLKAGAGTLGVRLSDAQLEQLDKYVELLLRWNEKVNLTAVTEPRAIVDKHLLDSLALVPLVHGRRIIDVGTGPGLPSVVLAVARPELQITAVESIFKKVTFVRTVVRELGLEIHVEPIRLEALECPVPFESAVSRATFEPAEWVERGAPLVASGGRLIAMLSAQQAVPSPPAGFSPETIVEHEIGGALRRIACYRKAG
jgi:16S rRNA (guanine527-N7)-methyltransferase